MEYVMVTDFNDHWDRIEGNVTSYSKNMLKSGMTKEKIASGTTTLFVKKSKYTGGIEKSWMGKVWDIEDVVGKIFFRVEIEKEVICPKPYNSFTNGWYYVDKVEDLE